MKKLLSIIIFFSFLQTFGQQAQLFGAKDYTFPYSVNIGTGKPKSTNPSAFLELGDSIYSKKGFLPPRGWKDSIRFPARGMMIHDVPTNKPWWHNGTSWQEYGLTSVSWNIITGKPSEFTPSSGSGYYIQASPASAQTANINIKGTFAASVTNWSDLSLSGTNGTLSLSSNGTNNNVMIRAVGPISQLAIYKDATTMQGRFINNNGATTLQSQIGTLTLDGSVDKLSATSGTAASVTITGSGTYTFAPTSGSANFRALEIAPKINQTGTATGNIYGIYYTPSLTSILGKNYAFYPASGLIHLAGYVSDPASAENGDLIYRTDINKARLFEGGAFKSLLTSTDLNLPQGQIAFGGSTNTMTSSNNLSTANSAGLMQLTLGGGGTGIAGFTSRVTLIKPQGSGQAVISYQNGSNVAISSSNLTWVTGLLSTTSSTTTQRWSIAQYDPNASQYEKFGIDSAGNIFINNLKTGSAAPITTGTLKPVIADGLGRLSFTDWPGEYLETTNANYTINVANGKIQNIIHEAAGSAAVTLPDPATNSGLTIYFKNTTTNTITFSRDLHLSNTTYQASGTTYGQGSWKLIAGSGKWFLIKLD